MFKEAESRPDKIESTSNNVQVRKKQQHRRRACDLLASLERFYSPNTRIFCKLTLVEFVDLLIGFLSLPAMTPVSQHDPDTGLSQ